MSAIPSRIEVVLEPSPKCQRLPDIERFGFLSEASGEVVDAWHVLDPVEIGGRDDDLFVLRQCKRRLPVKMQLHG
jgi:hypothetical protein